MHFEMQNLISFNTGFQSTEKIQFSKPKSLTFLNNNNKLGNFHQGKPMQTQQKLLFVCLIKFFLYRCQRDQFFHQQINHSKVL